MNKIILSAGFVFLSGIAVMNAQNETSENQGADTSVRKDSVIVSNEKIKVDGVAAVVGDYVILESDIDKSFLDMQTQGIPTRDITRCQLLGKLMEDKLYAHQAIQDSLEVSDVQIRDRVNEQVDYLVSQLGSIDKVVEFYRKSDEQSFRDELFEISKSQQLSTMMRSKIVDEVEITPEEVRQWFKKIPEDQLPVFGDEIEIAQIVKMPKPTEAEVQKTIDKLKSFKRDVDENGASFAIKQTLYSIDPGKNENGGVYTLTKKSGFVKEFKDVAFSLREGEISDPFETEFGWHIIKVEKVRGQEIDVRHILLRPEISDKALQDARTELDSIRSKVLQDKFSFQDAARNFSDEKETRFDGGRLINPTNFDTRFELTKMDPTLYNQVRNLQGDEMSQPLMEETRNGIVYKLIKIINRYPSHKANYSQDYIKIKELALKEKQLNAIQDWMTEKIKDTYVKVGADNKSCDFANNWLKK